MKNKITLKELAKLLNVSVSTVSKALHDSPEISPKTVERVKELAKLHNYRPNPVAVNLKSSKSNTIGVIIPNISNTFFANVLSGIEARSQEAGLQVITYISNESLAREQQIAEMLTSGFVDGVLIAISEETQRKKEYEHLFNLVDYDIPVVLYDRTNLDLPVDKIGIDDEHSLEEATRLLQTRGIKKIGIATSIHHLGVGKLRITGYRNALKNENDFYIANSSKPDILREKARKLLVEDKVEAILCTDFESTMLVYRLAYENKISIPKDLKVIGFINADVARYLTPSISYVDQFPEQIGEEAVELLVDRIENRVAGKLPINKTIHTKLMHLESTGF
ncbi:LacI family transcriptional regulator [Salegentibacter sp. JZCK2]|uniref:LacI family DNA-binding transcriptional regulator n=1 Tax=Salegentibacter tibetensis TaxID=2873600 RepID=UPI001CCD11A7|nr:LacI family DNA-binding transcriptional regulator [Salegentibacter tibetensis]MBZ9729098.1 LacI family transcriptional regulator [Salegentibacter tibetensis]